MNLRNNTYLMLPKILIALKIHFSFERQNKIFGKINAIRSNYIIFQTFEFIGLQDINEFSLQILQK